MYTEKDYEFMLSSISHEIRNPVTLIHSYLQLICSSHPEVQSFAYWDRLQTEMDYLQLLLSEISDLNNSTHLHPQSFALDAWLSDYAKSAALLIARQDKACQLLVQIEPALPVLSMDPTRLRQLLDNLIRNAVEASCDASQITLRAWQEADACCISVSDHGCGIAPEDELRLFEPFTTTKKDGTGLGLAISRRIAEAHHGTLSVHSAAGAGATFTLRLPMAG